MSPLRKRCIAATLALALGAPGFLYAADGAARLPTVPPVKSVLFNLQSKDWYVRDVADGYLYYLPDSDVPALEAAVGELPPENVGNVLNALLARKNAFAIKHIADKYFANSYHSSPLRLNELTAAELKPLATVVAERLLLKPELLKKVDNTISELANFSGELSLLRLLSKSSDSSVGHIGYSAENLAALWDDSDETQKIKMLNQFNTGWTVRPSPQFMALMSHANLQLRCAFIRSLSHSSYSGAAEDLKPALSDSSDAVATVARDSLITLKCPVPAAVLRELCINERFNHQTGAWSQAANQPDNELLPEARRIWKTVKLDREVSRSILKYLIAKGDLDTVLLGFKSSSAESRRAAIDLLIETGNSEVIDRLFSVLSREDVIMNSYQLSRAKNVKPEHIMQFLLDGLRDPSSATRAYAANGIEQIMHFNVKRNPKADATTTDLMPEYRKVKRWYEEYFKPPSDELREQIEQIQPLLGAGAEGVNARIERLNFDPIPALKWLAATQTSSKYALLSLAHNSDPRVDAIFAEFVVDEYFTSSNLRELEAALQSRPASVEVVDALMKWLNTESSEETDVALNVLLAWRAERAVSLLCDKVMNGGDSRHLDELIKWNPPQLLPRARKLATDKEARYD